MFHKMLKFLSVLFEIILLSGLVVTCFSQDKTEISQSDTGIANAISEVNNEVNNTVNYWEFILVITITVVAIFCIIIYYYLKSADKKMTERFQSSIIDDIVSGLMSSVSLNQNKLQEIIHNLIINNTPLPLSLKNLWRIEYQLEKKSPDIIIRTIIVAIEKESNIVLKKITRELLWDDLPNKIRHSFITEQKSNLFYSLYSINEANNDTTG